MERFHFIGPGEVTHSDLVMYAALSATLDARRLTYQKAHVRFDIYLLKLEGGGTSMETPTRLTFSESDNEPVAWTHDSKSILFTSDRTGKNQIFKQGQENDSAEPLFRALDDNESPFTLTPDGAWILLGAGANSRPSVPATTRLMRLPTQGGTPGQVMEWPTQGDLAGIDCPTHSGTACLISRWTEGKLTFYVLDPVHGQGKAVAETRLRKSDDLVHALSQDGTHIALTSKGQLPGKVRIWDVKTGSEREIDLPNEWNIYGGAGGVAGQYCWSADGKALFLMGRLAEPPRQYFLGRLSLDGKSQVFLKQAKSMWNLLASPDGQRLAFAQLTNESNAWMLENF